MHPSQPERPRRRGPFLFAAVAWVVVYLAALLALKKLELAPAVRITLAVLPAVPFVFFILLAIARIGAMDELQRKIHLEALALAYPLAMLLLMTLGLLDKAIVLASEEWSYSHLWFYLPLFYFVGLSISSRRYK